MNFSEKLKGYQEAVEKRLRSDLPQSYQRPARLHEAMNYSLLAGGKRLRPVLVLAAEQIYPAALDPMQIGRAHV